MKMTYAPFDAADYLNDDEIIAEYLLRRSKIPIPTCCLLHSPTSLKRAAGRGVPKTREPEATAP
jgi:hypothetical protein